MVTLHMLKKCVKMIVIIEIPAGRGGGDGGLAGAAAEVAVAAPVPPAIQGRQRRSCGDLALGGGPRRRQRR